MDRLHMMEVFAKVAEERSFARAGKALNLSPPAVTRAVSALEDRLGTRLILRTTRTLQLTDAGTRFLADATRILHEVQEADDAAAGSHAAPRGHLHITASVLFGRIFIAPILQDYLDANPQVVASALFVDRVVNLAEEGLDVAIRIGALPDSSLHAIRVGSVRRAICGAPSYFARHGVPQTPQELAAHRIVVAGGVTPHHEWQFVCDGAVRAVTVRPAIVFSTNDAAIEATASGWALTRVLSYQVAPQVEDGTLQTVLRDFEPPPLPVHVVHREGRRPSAKVRSFVDLAVARLRESDCLGWPG